MDVLVRSRWSTVAHMHIARPFIVHVVYTYIQRERELCHSYRRTNTTYRYQKSSNFAVGEWLEEAACGRVNGQMRHIITATRDTHVHIPCERHACARPHCARRHKNKKKKSIKWIFTVFYLPHDYHFACNTLCLETLRFAFRQLWRKSGIEEPQRRLDHQNERMTPMCIPFYHLWQWNNNNARSQ